jgi:phage shock protein PspC (stress-responsive transcriptional regulator)
MFDTSGFEGILTKKLYRSRTDRKIWGVCGGLAKYFNIDPTIVRVIAVASLFVGSLGFWIYIVMAIVVPVES